MVRGRAPVADGFAARDGESAEPGAEVLEEGTFSAVRAHALGAQQDTHVLVRCLQQLCLQLSVPNRLRQLRRTSHRQLSVSQCRLIRRRRRCCSGREIHQVCTLTLNPGPTACMNSPDAAKLTTAKEPT